MSDTKQVSVSRVIDAPAEAIFAVVADAGAMPTSTARLGLGGHG